MLRSRNKSRFVVGFWEYFGAAVFSTLFEKHSPRASGACGSHVERTLIRAFRCATLFTMDIDCRSSIRIGLVGV
ncbi:MAG: hypothetical protein DMF27_10695 [Verrucomicrobia bacterium]|nr:MAG: hypothetical protein DMF27_10695 [Verrucomicrobiota bacterium]